MVYCSKVRSFTAEFDEDLEFFQAGVFCDYLGMLLGLENGLVCYPETTLNTNGGTYPLAFRIREIDGQFLEFGICTTQCLE